jgi:phosphoglycerate dehydrogenase-like enzyme
VMGRPAVLITEPLDADALAWLNERCDLTHVEDADPSSLNTALAEAEAIIVRTYTRVDAAMLDRAPRLCVVGRAGVGVDNIDLAACKARGIKVVNTPEANTSAVVEYVFAMIFNVLRPAVRVERAITEDEWKRWRDELITPRELSESTLGILGLGRIGQAVAKVGADLTGRVVYHDLEEIPVGLRAGAEPVSRERLFAESDILSIHVDGRAANRNLIAAEAMAKMKADVVFINASRGFVVDAAALSAFLCEHPRATAILDVHDPEPVGTDSPLLGLRNAILTPHVGAATRRAKRNMSWVVKDVWAELEKSDRQTAAQSQSTSL